MAEKSDFQLEHELDAWWDGVAANDFSIDDPEPQRVDIATVQYLAVHHTGAAPDPKLVHELKERLMQAATIPTTAAEIPVASDVRREPATARVPRPFWPAQRRRLRGLAELAAVAALVLVFLGGAFGDGPFGGMHDLLPLADDQTGDTGLVGMYRGNAARTGVSSDPGPSGPPALRWQANIGQDWASPGATGAGAEGRVYFTNGELGDVSAYETATGGILWRATVGRMWAMSPAVGNGLVYVATAGPEAAGSDAGYLIALDAENGSERWRYKTGGSTNSSPAIEGDTVYVTALDQTLRAVDSLTGQERWRFDFTQQSPATPAPGTPVARGNDWIGASVAVADGIAYVTNTNEVIAVETQHGRERWRFDTDGNVIWTPAVADDTVFATVLDDSTATGWIIAIDATTGSKRWRVEAASLSQSTPAVADGLIFLHGYDGTAEGNIFTALDAKNGETVWTYQTDGVNSDMTYANGVVYGASFDGRIYALDAKTGTEIWQVDTGNSALRDPVIANGLVIVPSNFGDIYAIGGSQAGATPVSNNGAPVDVTGLPPCEPPRDVSPDELTGPPAATLLPPEGSGFRGPPQMKLAEIPDGEPPSGEAYAGVLETLRGMAACSRPSDQLALQGYFTDDYFRRDWVQNVRNPVRPDGFEQTATWPIPGADGKPATSLNDARALPDGRVGVVIMYSDDYGTYAVFVEQDGHWLIDERYELSNEIGKG